MVAYAATGSAAGAGVVSAWAAGRAWCRERSQGGIHPVFAGSGRPDYGFLSRCSRLTGPMRRRRCYWLVLLGSLILVSACCFRGREGKVVLDVGRSGTCSGLSCQRRIACRDSSEMNLSSRIEVTDYASCLCQTIEHNERRLNSQFAACQARTRKKGTERVQTLFATCVKMVGPEGFEPPTKRL
jgi:hypothetical protein